jgi:multidrug resistance efflux pump
MPFTWWLAHASPLPLTDPPAAPLEVRPAAPPDHPAPKSRPPQEKPNRLWMLLSLVLGGLIAYIVGQQFQQTAVQRPAASAGVRTTKVVKANFTRNIRLSGTVSAKSFAAIVAPQMRGGGGGGTVGGGFGSRSLVLMKMAEPGSFVQKGDVVAEFDRQDQEERMFRLRSDVVEAEANLEKRRAELAIEIETVRQELRVAEGESGKASLDLRTAEVRSQIEADLLKLAAQEAEAAFLQKKEEVALLEKSGQAELRGLELMVRQDELDYKRGEINAERMAIRTPIPGTVVMMTIFRGGGQFSQVSLGDELRSGTYFMQIVDPSAMVLEASFNQSDTQRLRVGQEAEVRLDAYPGKVWPGRLVSVGASTAASGAGMRGPNSGTGDYVRNVPVIVAIDGADREIIPDLSGSADVVLGTEKDALLAPREAVMHENGEAVVFIAGGERPRRQRVELGAASDTQVVLLNGVNEGDTLVVSAPAPKDVAAAR